MRCGSERPAEMTDAPVALTTEASKKFLNSKFEENLNEL